MIKISRSLMVSYFMFAATMVVIIVLHLGSATLAALVSYVIISAMYRLLSKWLNPFFSRWLSLILFAAVTVFLAWLLVLFFRLTLTMFPDILTNVMPKLNELSVSYKFDIPFDNIEEFYQVVIREVRENASAVTRASSFLTKEFFHILFGVLIAVLNFMSIRTEKPDSTIYEVVRSQFNGQVGRFVQSFGKVFGAQIVISAINTLLTAAFLVAFGFPYAAFLVPATFFLGLIPVVGNLLSNTIIVCTALTLSLQHAILALCFLVLIHKGEYVLNSRIVGASIDAPMWQTLLCILVGEIIMGVPGIFIAPAVWFYARKEMKSFKVEELKATN